MTHSTHTIRRFVLGALMVALAASPGFTGNPKKPFRSGVFSGTIKSVSSGRLSVESASREQTVAFKLTDRTLITINRRNASAAKLEAGMQVSVFVNSFGKVLRVKAVRSANGKSKQSRRSGSTSTASKTGRTGKPGIAANVGNGKGKGKALGKNKTTDTTTTTTDSGSTATTTTDSSTSSSSTTTTNSTTTTTSTGRIDWSNAKYLGAFRLPLKPGGGSRFGYAVAATAYCAAHNSLFIAGHAYDDQVAELGIPTPKDIGTDVSKTGDLPLAKVLRPFASPCGSVKLTNSGGAVDLGGLAVLPIGGKDRLAWTQYDTYDTAGTDHPSHGYCELDFSAPKGLWNIANAHHNMSAGYLCLPPPSESSGVLKGLNLLTGQQGVAGQGAGSWGPALFATRFDVTFPDPGKDVASKPLVYYPSDNRYPGWGLASRVRGAAWLYTDSAQAVAFLVTIGKGKEWYGPGADYPYYEGGDPWDPSKGYHAPPYSVELWLFDPKDLLAVAAGTVKPWAPRPYATIDLSKTLLSGNPKRGNMDMAFNAKDKLLYITWADIDGSQSQYEKAPVVSVFKVN